MRKLLATAVAAGIAVCAGAQQNLGIATSNWSGIESVYQNPANIADSRTKVCIEIVGLNAGVDNNLGYINSNGGIIGAINRGSLSNIFAYSNSNSFSVLAPYAQVHLPGLMIAIDHKNSIALTTSINGINQFNNFDRSLYQLVTDPTYTPGSDVSVTSSKFNYTAHIWSQVGLTYGGVILDQGSSEVKIGVTLRYLGGIGYIGLKGNNLNVNYKASNDSVYVANSDLEYASNILSTNNALLNGVSNNSILSEFFGSKSGMGVGGDLGIVYDYNPASGGGGYAGPGKKAERDYSRNRYKLRLSASVMDLGSISYRASSNSNANVTGNGYVTAEGLSHNVTNFNSFKTYMLKQGFSADTNSEATKLYMPTTLHLGADYKIWHAFYVNATYIANLVNREDFGNSYYNQFTVTPRFDTRTLSVGLPITYSMLTGGLKAGVGVRVYGFYAGSDDLLGLFANHQYGFNFYIGGILPFNYVAHPRRHRHSSDTDSLDKDQEPDMEHGGSSDTTAMNTPLLRKMHHTGECPAAPLPASGTVAMSASLNKEAEYTEEPGGRH